ncbi:hypothetical protein ILP97_00925 [Amycolatopsis sp. H6(2020)]|nr:hypothetical protein [Amycolatopsis sp. H6(2020)]
MSGQERLPGGVGLLGGEGVVAQLGPARLLQQLVEVVAFGVGDPSDGGGGFSRMQPGAGGGRGRGLLVAGLAQLPQRGELRRSTAPGAGLSRTGCSDRRAAQ